MENNIPKETPIQNNEVNIVAKMGNEPTQSDTIGKLAEALAKAQGEMTTAKSNSENSFFGSKYAELWQVIDATRPFLSKNGLCITQMTGGVQVIPNVDPKPFLLVITQLIHTSGEWLRSSFPVPIEKPVNSHKYVSAMTYGRRTGWAAMTGIAQADDDGNASTVSSNNESRQIAKPKKRPDEYNSKRMSAKEAAKIREEAESLKKS